MVFLGLGLGAFHLWRTRPGQDFSGEGVAVDEGGYEYPLYAVDPTDGVIPDVYDPMFIGAMGGSGVGMYLDGDITQIEFPEDELLPPPDTPTLMPDGTIVVNGEIIQRPGGDQ